MLFAYSCTTCFFNHLNIESYSHPIEESWVLWCIWASPKQSLQVLEGLVYAGRLGGEPWHFPGMFTAYLYNHVTRMKQIYAVGIHPVAGKLSFSICLMLIHCVPLFVFKIRPVIHLCELHMFCLIRPPFSFFVFSLRKQCTTALLTSESPHHRSS